MCSPMAMDLPAFRLRVLDDRGLGGRGMYGRPRLCTGGAGPECLGFGVRFRVSQNLTPGTPVSVRPLECLAEPKTGRFNVVSIRRHLSARLFATAHSCEACSHAQASTQEGSAHGYPAVSQRAPAPAVVTIAKAPGTLFNASCSSAHRPPGENAAQCTWGRRLCSP
jgi:hypothetical protein